MPNALAAETSPYLRQHAGNPVDWLPWGEAALARARDGDRPLLVSIGYSACHWCHVMEHESFEDERTAALMNAHFVCVKVDREERPDVDAIYMDAVQGMTGHGGWPLNVFLTPEQLPFYGGTYFPPAPRHGLPSWTQVLEAVAHAWDTDRERIRADGERMRTSLRGAAGLAPATEPLQAQALDGAVGALRRAFDPVAGGFGDAPKFPPSTVLEFLLARAACTVEQPDQKAAGPPGPGAMALATLRAMAAGGIHDQVGGGFHRYSVDAQWIVPHFEKMLYDNALLARAYLHGWQFSGDRALLDVCLGTLQWVLREMRAPDGGFYAALDADSEGHEGRFYVWTVAELRETLGADADAAIELFQVTEHGNFAEPGAIAATAESVLQGGGPTPGPQRSRAIRERLLAARTARIRPGCDDKRITSWNALMVAALAQAGAALAAAGPDDLPADLPQRLLAAAREGADFVLERLRTPDGRLLRTYSQGSARLPAYLEDHAFLLEALLALYEATFEERWFVHARGLADTLIDRFGDPERGGFFTTADDHPPLAVRRKDVEDAPIPAGASSAALGLLRLAALTGEYEYERQAVGTLALVQELAPRHPLAFGHALVALDLHIAPPREVALVGTDRGPLERVLRSALRPHVVVAAGPGDGAASAVALLQGRTAVGGRAAAHVCRRHVCALPVTEPVELAAQL